MRGSKKKYVMDKKSNVFIHPIVKWERENGRIRPLISDGEKLVYPENHEIYKRGYEVVDKLF